MPNDDVLSCGPLRRHPDGRWFFGDMLVGRDGAFDADAFANAVETFGVDALEPVQGWRAPDLQTRFSWPMEFPNLVNVDANISLAQHHAEIWSDLDTGVFCNACQRQARRYQRPFHKEMAQYLVRLVHAWMHKGKKWRTLRELDVRDARATKASTDGTYLVAWKLIQRHPLMRAKYKPTDKGIAFVKGRLKVPASAYIYAGTAHKFCDPLITIQQALGAELDVRSMLHNTEAMR